MCSCVIVMRPELKIVLVAVEIIVVIAAALALEQCGTGSENSDKGYISGEYSGGAQENIDYEAKTVAIDSGHGGIDPGKISADGILEKDVNLAIASKLKILLEQSGITVIMTRADDNGLYQESDSNKKAAYMKIRCSIINGSKSDIAVSIHQNSYVGEASKGAQVFYYKQSEEGKKLAGIIQKNMIKELDNTNKRVEKPDSAYYMLRNTQVPTVIVECGFLSNREEAYKLNNDEYQQKTAYSIYCGIIEYLGQN